MPGDDGVCGTHPKPCSNGYDQKSYKCARCKENWYQASDGTCKICAGASETDDKEAAEAAKAMTVTIYTVAGICFMIFFAFAVSLYLRDDSGASF
jgi:hypothetical protein